MCTSHLVENGLGAALPLIFSLTQLHSIVGTAITLHPAVVIGGGAY